MFVTVPHRRLSPISSRIVPKQRAVFVAAARVEGDIAKKVAKALAALQRKIKTADLIKALEAASMADVFRLADKAGIEALATGLGPELVKGLELGAALGAKDAKAVGIDLMGPRVSAWTKRHGAELVTRVNRTTKAALKIVVDDGVRRGVHPKMLAKDIKGSVGLTKPHARAIVNRRAALDAAGVPKGRIERIVAKYSDDLLKFRAKMIARTESMAAVNGGRLEMWKQLQDDGALAAGQKQEWLTAEDERVCEICGPMDGQPIIIGEEFVGTKRLKRTDQIVEFRTEAPPIHPQCRCTVVLV